jgi:undecaprenyl pyrophosphate synthase
VATECSCRNLNGADRSGFLQQHGIRLRCIGRMELLKPEMQKALQEMEAATAGNRK